MSFHFSHMVKYITGRFSIHNLRIFQQLFLDLSVGGSLRIGPGDRPALQRRGYTLLQRQCRGGSPVRHQGTNIFFVVHSSYNKNMRV